MTDFVWLAEEMPSDAGIAATILGVWLVLALVLLGEKK